MATERVTVTLSAELLTGIDRLDRNRSRFIAEAVGRELERRRRELLRASLAEPHPESEGGEDIAGWAASLPSEDVSVLLDLAGGSPIRWEQGKGWSSH